MIKINLTGSTKRTQRYLALASTNEVFLSLDDLGQKGVNALARFTPKDTGLTADLWTYTIETDDEETTIAWHNTSEANRPGMPPIVILLQYGHADRSGGWVAGRDFIGPAIEPIFDQIATEVWERLSNE